MYLCKKCETPLTNRESLESNNYVGSTGKALLFTKVVNIRCSEVQERTMMTGKHFVRDVFCKGCEEKLGWMYEYAVPETQRHKEGKVILEESFLRKCK